MNSEFSPTPQEELEAQITALLLGELPENEAAALREKIAADPELRQLHTQIGMTIGLLKEAIASPEPAEIAAPEGLKMSEERREKLLASFKVVKAPKPVREPIRIDFKSWGALAAMIVGLLAIAQFFVATFFATSRRTAQSGDRELKVYSPLGVLEAARDRGDISNEEFQQAVRQGEPPTKGKSGPQELSLSEETIVSRSVRGVEQARVSVNGQTPNVRFDSDAERAGKKPEVANRINIELPKLETAAELDKAPNTEVALSIQPTTLGAGTTIGGAFVDQNSAWGRTVAGTTAPAAAEPSLNLSFGGGGGGGIAGGVYGGRGYGGMGGMRGVPGTPAAPQSTLGFGVSPAPANGPQRGQDWFDRDSDQRANLFALNAPAQNKAGEPVQTATGVTLGKDVVVADQIVAQTESPRGRTLGRELEDQVALKQELNKSETLAARSSEVGALKKQFAGVAVDGLQSVDGGRKVPAKADSKRIEQVLSERRTDPSTGLALDEFRDAEAKSKPTLAPPLAEKPESQVAREEFSRDKITTATKVQNAWTLIENGRLAEAESLLKEADKEDPGQRVVQYYQNLIRENKLSQAASVPRAGLPIQQVERAADLPGRPGMPGMSGGAGGQGGMGTTGMGPGMAYYMSNPELMKRYFPQMYAQMQKQNSNAAAGEVTPNFASTPGKVADAAKLNDLQKIEEQLVAKNQKERDLRQIYTKDAKLVKENAAEIAELTAQKRKIEAELPAVMLERGAQQAASEGKELSNIRIVEPATAKTNSFGFLDRFRDTSAKSVVALNYLPSEPAPQTGVVRADARGEGIIVAEAEMASSYDVAKRVVEKLGLTTEWAGRYGGGQKLNEAAAAGILRKMIEVKTTDGGRIEISAKGANSAESARLANATTEAYIEKHLEVHRDLGDLVPALEKNPNVGQQQEALKEIKDVDAAARPKPSASSPIPQPEVSTAANAFSTFSLNVSDVSFKLAAASLEKSVMPEAGAIRSEEFINAFDYRDPAAVSAPVAFAWERARYPFAHDRDLLRFSVKTAASGREAGKPLNLVLLLDSSGSMERADRVRIIRECLRVLAGQLQAQDKVSVVTFARTPRLWVDGLSGAAAATELVERVGTATPE